MTNEQRQLAMLKRELSELKYMVSEQQTAIARIAAFIKQLTKSQYAINSALSEEIAVLKSALDQVPKLH